MSAVLGRQVFSVSRAADFLETRALVSQTGQPESRFGDVVVKELLDNALDASETGGCIRRSRSRSRPAARTWIS